jgi:hypothetical protein
MRKILFIGNTTLTTIAVLVTILKFLQDFYGEGEIICLLILGIFQIVSSVVLTIYSAFKNHKLLVHYLIYWLLVVAFLTLLFHHYFYSCIVLALYNLYLNYCSFNSKYNISKL